MSLILQAYGGGEEHLAVVPATQGLSDTGIMLIAIPSLLFFLYVAFRVWRSLKKDERLQKKK